MSISEQQKKQANDFAAAVLGIATLPLTEEALGRIVHATAESRTEWDALQYSAHAMYTAAGVAVARAVVTALSAPEVAWEAGLRLRSALSQDEGTGPHTWLAALTVAVAKAATLPKPSAVDDAKLLAAECDRQRADEQSQILGLLGWELNRGLDTPLETDRFVDDCRRALRSKLASAERERDDLASMMLGRPVSEAADIPRAVAHARKLVEPFNRTMAKLWEAERAVVEAEAILTIVAHSLGVERDPRRENILAAAKACKAEAERGRRVATENNAARIVELAAALRIEPAPWATLLAKVAPAGENRQARHNQMCEALGVEKQTGWDELAAHAIGMRDKVPATGREPRPGEVWRHMDGAECCYDGPRAAGGIYMRRIDGGCPTAGGRYYYDASNNQCTRAYEFVSSAEPARWRAATAASVDDNAPAADARPPAIESSDNYRRIERVFPAALVIPPDVLEWLSQDNIVCAASDKTAASLADVRRMRQALVILLRANGAAGGGVVVGGSNV